MTEEDEAFDEIARKQGMWGGGFQAKKAMAADKLQESWNEDEWRRNNWRCQHGWLRGEQCEICNASLAPKPAQEPVAWPCLIVEADFSQDTVTLTMQCDDYKVSAHKHWLSTTPPKREWVDLTEEDFSIINQSCFTKLQAATSAESILKERNT